LLLPIVMMVTNDQLIDILHISHYDQKSSCLLLCLSGAPIGSRIRASLLLNQQQKEKGRIWLSNRGTISL